MSSVATPRARAGFAGMAAALGSALLAASRMADAKTDGAWVMHHDPAGFWLQRPADWQVQAGNAGEIAITDPRGTAAALVRARIVPARADLAQWLQQHYAATEPGLYNVRMLKAEGRGAQVVHAAFDYGSNVFQGRASVIAARRGDMATLFIAAAARVDFAQRLPELARILGSLRFSRPGPGEAFEASAHDHYDDTGAKPLRGLDLTRLLRIGTEVPDR